MTSYLVVPTCHACAETEHVHRSEPRVLPWLFICLFYVPATVFASTNRLLPFSCCSLEKHSRRLFDAGSKRPCFCLYGTFVFCLWTAAAFWCIFDFWQKMTSQTKRKRRENWDDRERLGLFDDVLPQIAVSGSKSNDYAMNIKKTSTRGTIREQFQAAAPTKVESERLKR